MLSRRLVHRCGKARVAAATAPAAGNHKALVRLRELEHFLAGLVVIHDGPDRNFQNHIAAVASGLVGTLAVTSALRAVLRIEAEVHQRIVALAGFHDDVAAFASVAAGRPPARNELLPPEGHAAVAAVARFNPN